MELVRHRLASFSQESTRYCNYSIAKFGKELTFIIPSWLDLEEGTYIWFSDHGIICNENSLYTDEVTKRYLQSLFFAERDYIYLTTSGWTAQKARAILPNSLKTEIVVTANMREWRTIFTQRTDLAAHPQMRELMVPLLAEMKTLIPILFDDI